MAASICWGATSVPVHLGSSCTGTGKTVLVCSSTAPLWLIHWHTLSFPTPVWYAWVISLTLSVFFVTSVWFCVGFIFPQSWWNVLLDWWHQRPLWPVARRARKRAALLPVPPRLTIWQVCQPQSIITKHLSPFLFQILKNVFVYDLLQSLTAATRSVVVSPSSEGSLLPGSTPAVVRAA